MSCNSRRRRKRKHRRYLEQKGRCYWCGRKMRFWHKHKNGTPPPADLATFEHLDDRFNEWRGKSSGLIRVVLACYKCNHERGQQSAATQEKEELWERSGAYPQGHPKATDYSEKWTD